MKVEQLIEEMQETKAQHPTLELADILKIFNIQAMQELTKATLMGSRH